ncbi:biofilm regulation phosphoprotein SiaC [Pararhodospirillum photometricum]|uniref:SiaC family regulatory phosphoprotein domain-containing protein n=1 Tax=Pararhodospirillum photometricum DSM 122 TaxID=1150469 RepID=H6SMF9_PARPM|nr:biofilm regulation phosphoprotein SiaC [Pararhodospirillum photometricum]CCG06842.1 Putative uncharacterized protein [Pararhodospirillum photometricum DSM 122]
METLEIAQTKASPLIRADWETGTITMCGDSYPENSFEFFQPLIDWVEAFLAHDSRPLLLELELLYLNTSSIRTLMDILDQLEEASRQGRLVRARWLYDAANERVGELAQEFKEDCTFPFDIVTKAEAS